MNRDIEILKKCRGLRREIGILQRQIELDRISLYGAAIAYSDLPKAQGNPHSRDGRYAALCDKEDARLAKVNEYKECINEAERILSNVADSTERAVYRLCYIEGVPIWKISTQLYISERTIYRLKEKAESEERLR